MILQQHPADGQDSKVQQRKNDDLCQWDPDTLIAAVDGELSADQREQLAGHLSGCASCRKVLSELQAVSSMCRALPQAQPPEGLIEEILDSLPNGQRSLERRNMWALLARIAKGFVPIRREWAYATAAVALVIVAVLAASVSNFVSVGPRRLVASVVAAADEEISAMDLVYSYDPSEVQVQAVEKAVAGHEFVICTRIGEGQVRISMASSSCLDLADPEPILEIPIRVKGSAISRKEYLRLESVRVYRPDGRPTSVTLDEISMPRRGHAESGKRATA